MNKKDKSIFKMTSKELQSWLHNRSRGYTIQNKKGKGSYKRKDKYNNYDES